MATEMMIIADLSGEELESQIRKLKDLQAKLGREKLKVQDALRGYSAEYERSQAKRRYDPKHPALARVRARTEAERTVQLNKIHAIEDDLFAIKNQLRVLHDKQEAERIAKALRKTDVGVSVDKYGVILDELGALKKMLAESCRRSPGEAIRLLKQFSNDWPQFASGEEVNSAELVAYCEMWTVAVRECLAENANDSDMPAV